MNNMWSPKRQLSSTNVVIPSFTENSVKPVFNLEHQISLLRSVNENYRNQIFNLSSENMVLRARVSVLIALLCDAGIPLPPDIE